MTRKDRIAELRQELDRLEREERESRPALAAGQVWKDIERGDYYLSHLPHDSALVSDCRLVCVGDGVAWSTKPWFEGDDFGDESQFVYVGLARDVLRVDVPGEVSAPPSAPPQAEPTGAELVGKLCWISDNGLWHLRTVHSIAPSGHYIFLDRDTGGEVWAPHAKLYREGVAP